jgi:hypothetical protein
MIGAEGARLEPRAVELAAVKSGVRPSASVDMVSAVMRPRLQTLVGIFATLALVGTAGCGSSSSGGSGLASKSPAEIVTAAQTAADSARTVHVVGSIVNSGAPIALDMELVNGTGGRGRLSENGLSFELVEVGGYVYIKGSQAFYSHVAGSAAAQLLDGKWLKASANSGTFSSLTSLTNLRKLLDSTLTSHGTLTKGATSTVEGQQAIAVKDATRGGTLYVATSGTSYPLQIAKSGSGGGKITFNRWNDPVKLAAPPNSVDLSKLQSGH